MISRQQRADQPRLRPIEDATAVDIAIMGDGENLLA